MTDSCSTDAQATNPAARATARLWLLNVVLAALLHLRFLRGVEPSGAQAQLFLVLALVSNAFVLSLLPALLSSVLSFCTGPWPRLRRALVALVWTLLLAAIWFDANIWGLFHYHFNGMVWATITNPAAGDAVHIATSEFVFYGCLAGALWFGEAFCLRRFERLAPRGFRPQTRLVMLALLLPMTLVEKAIYARANLVRDRRVTSIARIFPLYQRLTVKRLAVKHFGYDATQQLQLDMPASSSMMNYPRTELSFGEPLATTKAGRLPNIAIIVIDSLRHDAYTDELMPRARSFARERQARVFEDHYSAGNGTRFGLFGLLYSLYGSYWLPVLAEEISPVLIDSLLDLDYQMGVFSSASMSYPEFRRSAWVRIERDVHDSWGGGSSSMKDSAQVPALKTWLDALDDKPFFLFSLLDSPHQIYSFPTEGARFRPFTEHVNYTGLAGGASQQEQIELRNSYKNAVLHADHVLGEMLDALATRGLLEDTIVIITGDHGEEFWEHGFFGHTSNFTDVQLHVPFVMMGPGVAAGTETLPTSHLDLAPTLLEMLGADPSLRSEWCLGASLFEPPGQDRRRVSSSWDLLGLHTPDAVLVVPTNTHRGLVEGWTLGWQPMLEDAELIRREGGPLARLAFECGRFLR